MNPNKKDSEVIVFMVIAGACVMLFFLGYHNMDMGHNMLILENVLGVTMTDVTLGGQVIDGSFSYRMGVLMMMVSFIVFGIVCMKVGHIIGGEHNGR